MTIGKDDIEHYRQCLWMYGTMMVDLSQDEGYITRLMRGKKLDAFEQALRQKINTSRKQKI